MAEPDIVTQVFNRDKAPPSEPHETKTFAGRCHCRRIQFNITLSISSLPLRSLICHCSTCRYTHGTFGSFNVMLPPGVKPDWISGSSQDKLAGFEPPNGQGERLFCPSCGTNVGHLDEPRGQWAVSFPIFDEKFWEIRFHTYPQSAPGGGLADWVPAVGGQKVIHVSPEGNDFPAQSESEVGVDDAERLRAECCCGGVSFTIPRPSQEIFDDDYMRTYVSPSDPKKWKAFLDLCRDCGRLSGTSVMPWILIPRIALGPEMPSDMNIGTIKTYRSSKPNTRGFCGTCGATVFIMTTHRMPTERQTVVNIAMGILRAPEGVEAGNWATWRTGNAAWAGDARTFDADFVDALVKGHGKWGTEKYGEALDFAVI
ncbi:Mss4-like protein [Xylariales sp. AK1849]|nr:Mss4-like protein [Xylariales sp. AK1849]